MTDKRWSIALLLATIAVAGAFASGNNDKEDWNRSRPQRNGGPGMMADQDGRGRPPRLDNLETETYTGSFTMVDNMYPALVTADGDTWYLMIPFTTTEDSIPKEGTVISVEAAVSPRSPVHLIVVSAVIDGEELVIELPQRNERGGRGARGGGRRG